MQHTFKDCLKLILSANQNLFSIVCTYSGITDIGISGGGQGEQGRLQLMNFFEVIAPDGVHYCHFVILVTFNAPQNYGGIKSPLQPEYASVYRFFYIALSTFSPI